MRRLNLDILKAGVPLISEKTGAFLAEAAAICLTLNGYKSGVQLKVEGEIQETFLVEWSDKITKSILDSWNDVKEATEFGATAIAIMVLLEITDYTYFIRAYQGTGVDYWLGKGMYTGEKIPIAERQGKLEISGILKATKSNTINMRINQKKKQVVKTDHTNLPIYIAVVEFSQPKAKILKK
ncbi:MAG: hypothetical protein AAGJ18_07335 [Bacteroidota bacterium]